ncbi:hypothetical protein CRENPOLYSF1_710004 [Crenothrix polyspora]|uniref:Uncharacterized protein n=1 Tax=Crenothrix polyspora TaxID=360316 RepID=A0A1R4HH14_9GAMM|nr:hypothetical protein CRENPOLYSF1_710004 [Crenothrix polyspora]
MVLSGYGEQSFYSFIAFVNAACFNGDGYKQHAGRLIHSIDLTKYYFGC